MFTEVMSKISNMESLLQNFTKSELRAQFTTVIPALCRNLYNKPKYC